MKIKNKHDEFKNFKTESQLAKMGLKPTDEGIELWTNGYCWQSAVYYDQRLAVKMPEENKKKVETLFVWNSYFKNDYFTCHYNKLEEHNDLVKDEIAILDEDGEVVFDELIKPSLIEECDKKWFDRAMNHGKDITEIIRALTEKQVINSFRLRMKSFPDVKKIVSYNNHFNVPKFLFNSDYEQIDLMEKFAETYGETITFHNYQFDEKYDEYKWQKISQFFVYYGIRPKSNSALGYAEAIRQCYFKMNK